MNKVKFAKIKSGAIIPTKLDENAGYDIYPCFEDDYIIIEPNETKMIPCGIASAFDDDYVMVLKERGSTGTRGIGQRAGVIDSGFRGEWICPITNHTNYDIVISNMSEDDLMFKSRHRMIIYPKSKAICQALLLPVPKVELEEITYDELLLIKSERGLGKLGSSGK